MLLYSGFDEQRGYKENAERRLKRGEWYAGRHAASACADGLGCTHQVLFAWATTGCDLAVPVVQDGGDTDLGIIAGIRRHRSAEPKIPIFKRGHLCWGYIELTSLQEVGHQKSVKKFCFCLIRC